MRHLENAQTYCEYRHRRESNDYHDFSLKHFIWTIGFLLLFQWFNLIWILNIFVIEIKQYFTYLSSFLCFDNVIHGEPFKNLKLNYDLNQNFFYNVNKFCSIPNKRIFRAWIFNWVENAYEFISNSYFDKCYNWVEYYTKKKNLNKLYNPNRKFWISFLII